MSAFKNGSIVIAGTVMATGLTSIRQLLDGKLSMKPIISGFIVGTGLLLLAFASTPVAAALALLLLATSVMVNGAAILEKVT